MPLEAGQVICNDKFKVIRQLHTGELAEYWLAEETEGGRRVVLKRLRDDLGHHKEAELTAFDKEASAILERSRQPGAIKSVTREPDCDVGDMLVFLHENKWEKNVNLMLDALGEKVSNTSAKTSGASHILSVVVLSIALLLPWLLVWFGFINNHGQLMCYKECQSLDPLSNMGTIDNCPYHELWQRALCIRGGLPIVWVIPFWLIFLCTVCLALIWVILRHARISRNRLILSILMLASVIVISFHLEPRQWRLVFLFLCILFLGIAKMKLRRAEISSEAQETFFLLSGIVILGLAFLWSTWFLLTLNIAQFFDPKVGNKLTNQSQFEIMRWGLMLLLWGLMCAVLRSARRLGIVSRERVIQALSSLWTNVQCFFRYSGCRLIDVIDEGGQTVSGTPLDVCYHPKKHSLVLFYLPTTSAAPSTPTLVIRDRDGRYTTKVQATEESKRLAVHSPDNIGFVCKNQEIYSVHLDTGNATLLYTHSERVDLITCDSTECRLFLYAKQELYVLTFRVPTSGTILPSLFRSRPIESDAIWFCAQTKTLVLVSKVDTPSPGKKRGDKRIEVLNCENSQDYFQNTPASKAGFQEVRDITTTQCARGSHKILVLHRDPAIDKEYKVAVYAGMGNKKMGQQLCELRLPRRIDPFAMATDSEDNLWILGSDDNRGLKLLAIRGMRIALHSHDWSGLVK